MFSVKQSTLEFASLVLTHECNLECSFCVDEYRGRKEYITEDNVRKALDFGKEIGVKDILLVGGEPTLHPDVVKIAEMIKDYGFRGIMTTNYTKPKVVRQLDGIIDCLNISFYDQSNLPIQEDFKSDLSLHTLIHKGRIKTIDELDQFIDNHQQNGHLKFSTLTVCNDWTKENQTGSFLDNLDCEWVVLFNEILGQVYRDSIIKRHDRVINPEAYQSYKFHVDGKISQTWKRSISYP